MGGWEFSPRPNGRLAHRSLKPPYTFHPPPPSPLLRHSTPTLTTHYTSAALPQLPPPQPPVEDYRERILVVTR